MCTLVMLRRPGADWPLIVASNRDEAVDRPWRPPARHWPDREEVIAGIDEEAGGSWLGMDDHGVIAAILNRRHSLGPAADKRSRGELVLEALDHASAGDAAEALSELNAHAYRAFNMAVLDADQGFWIKSTSDDGDGSVEIGPVPEDISILTAWDLNDTRMSERARHYLPRFREAAVPDPATDDWQSWIDLLASTDRETGVEDPNGAMHVATDWGFGTVSSSLMAIPSTEMPDATPVWRFAAAWPQRTGFTPVSLAPL